jgi:hypothetical protein
VGRGIGNKDYKETDKCVSPTAHRPHVSSLTAAAAQDKEKNRCPQKLLQQRKQRTENGCLCGPLHKLPSLLEQPAPQSWDHSEFQRVYKEPKAADLGGIIRKSQAGNEYLMLVITWCIGVRY